MVLGSRMVLSMLFSLLGGRCYATDGVGFGFSLCASEFIDTMLVSIC